MPHCGTAGERGKERCPLLRPLARHLLHQLVQLHRFRLPAVEDGFDDVGGEERQAEQPVDEAAGEAFGLGVLSRRTPSG